MLGIVLVAGKRVGSLGLLAGVGFSAEPHAGPDAGRSV